MPYVNIRIAGALSRGQKAKIAAEITDTLQRIAHKQVIHLVARTRCCEASGAGRAAAGAPAPEGCAPPCRNRYIAFDELPDENWVIAGKLLDEE